MVPNQSERPGGIWHGQTKMMRLGSQSCGQLRRKSLLPEKDTPEQIRQWSQQLTSSAPTVQDSVHLGWGCGATPVFMSCRMQTSSSDPIDNCHIYIYIYIIIFILSRHERGSSCASPTTIIYRPSLPVSLQAKIVYLHRAVVCRFSMVVLPLLLHMKGSIGVCYLWVRPYFFRTFPHVWFVYLR